MGGTGAEPQNDTWGSWRPEATDGPTLANVPPELKFAGLLASLRAPRLAIVIPCDDWVFFARRAIEFLSQTWGGAGGVVIPMSDSGEVDVALYRLLRRYDPDYIASLNLSLADVETLRPGWFPLREDGVAVPESDRWQFIRRAEERGPQYVSHTVEDAQMAAIADKLNCFEESGRTPRVHRVHPGRPAYTPLAPVQSEPERQVSLESGDKLIDLALGMKAGLSYRPTSARSVRNRSLTRHQIAAFLTGEETYAPPSPMEDTRAGLTWIRNGFVADRRPLVVLGSDPSDMAVAMLWDRMTGRGIWLPVGHRHTTWHSAIGSSLDLARLRGEASILMTSTSLTKDQCLARIRRLWGARELIDPTSGSEPWDYVSPNELDLTGRLDLRVNDKWDERFAAPFSSRMTGPMQWQPLSRLSRPLPPTALRAGSLRSNGPSNRSTLTRRSPVANWSPRTRIAMKLMFGRAGWGSPSSPGAGTSCRLERHPSGSSRNPSSAGQGC